MPTRAGQSQAEARRSPSVAGRSPATREPATESGKTGRGAGGKGEIVLFFLLFYYRVGPEGMFDRGRWIVSCVEVHRVLSWMWDLAFLLVDFK